MMSSSSGGGSSSDDRTAARDATNAAGNRQGQHATTTRRPRGTVVVLDDDRLFRRSIARVLRSSGFDVIEVDSSAELAAVLEGGPVDLIVADSRLADGSDGWVQARDLAEAHGGLRVLLISGYDPEAIRAVGGFADVPYVRKRGSGFNIVRAVEDALAGKRGEVGSDDPEG